MTGGNVLKKRTVHFAGLAPTVWMHVWTEPSPICGARAGSCFGCDCVHWVFCTMYVWWLLYLGSKTGHKSLFVLVDHISIHSLISVLFLIVTAPIYPFLGRKNYLWTQIGRLGWVGGLYHSSSVISVILSGLARKLDYQTGHRHVIGTQGICLNIMSKLQKTQSLKLCRDLRALK